MTDTAVDLLDQGVDPAAGAATGTIGFHWAADLGNRGAVEMLIDHRVPLEIKNMYGRTVFGTAIWSAVHEPRGGHPAIIEALRRVGARIDAVSLIGHEQVDVVLRRHGLCA